ncbi:MAG TPA: cytochrome d ubiquinol oxidase subunit II [Gemmatimonadaceae bacterium]|nr:cytochrome d ubiquinol oxidase subunit II [Gemmatimonadaceae bacterium]
MSGLLTLPNILAGAVILALNVYVLLGGADFGGGVWDLLASGERRSRQRELIAHAIGPIWEANNVWLIVVVVLLFSCFPLAFSRLAISLHVPLSLMLIGIVLRGSAFTFRSYGMEDDAAQARWGRVFAIASTATPVLLGICLGAVATGRLPSVWNGGFVRTFVQPWLTAFGVGVGLLALALFSFLAAVYLTVEAPDDALRDDFRRRALWAAVALFATAFGTLFLSLRTAPLMWRGLVASPFALALQIATAVAALTAIGALWTRRYRLARGAAVAQVSLILWGWALSQYPYMIPPTLTVAGAAAPERTLALVLGVLAIGALVLLPSLSYLFRIFKAG